MINPPFKTSSVWEHFDGLWMGSYYGDPDEECIVVIDNDLVAKLYFELSSALKRYPGSSRV